MLRSVLSAVFLLASSLSGLAAEFVGKVEFTETGCEQRGACILKSDFGYIDSTGVGWQAKAGNKTDGASIPPRLQPYIGQPFDADLIRAAIIHDHYCDRHVKSWADTHWVFYDALLTSQVDWLRALKMYVGVLLGGPKWIWEIAGEQCPIGITCTRRARTVALPEDGASRTNSEGEHFVVRAARYTDPDFARELARAGEEIDKLRPGAGRPEAEALAKFIRPRDKFLNGTDAILR